MAQYTHGEKRKRSWLGRVLIALVIVAALGALALFIGWRFVTSNLVPVDPKGSAQEITIEQGLSVGQIGEQLEKAGLIRKAWAFQRYVQFRGGASYLQAGTYTLSPSQSTPAIVEQLTHGKVATQLVTILPGQRLDQVRTSLVNQGFSEASVDAALEPTQYESLAVLADKPKGASLEGYLYPESFERTNTTTAKDIIEQSIVLMGRQLTTERKQKFEQQGLTTYQALILASIVEKEVVTQTDRAQVAQVFIKRIQSGISLGSDITAFYGSELAGAGQDVTYDTPYNTRIHTGFPPTPVSNVSTVSLDAVASPASTDWLFFVAGDDGVTHFSRTVEEHNALVKQYCHVLCQ